MVRGLLLDVEGVLVADKRYAAVDSAVEFVQWARGEGLPFRLITNNTTDDRPAIVEKLRKTGFDLSLNDLGGGAAEVLVVSDDPFSDLAGAKRVGMRGAFVLSGKYRDASVVDAIPEAERPDIIVPRIGDLVEGGRLRL